MIPEEYQIKIAKYRARFPHRNGTDQDILLELYGIVRFTPEIFGGSVQLDCSHWALWRIDECAFCK